MPSTVSLLTAATAAKLGALGKRIRAGRKALKVSATTAAEAAGMSRVTLHRIERGEPSVTIGSYLNVLAALGLDFGIAEPNAADVAKETMEERKGWIPARIRIADYPQLKRAAWQIQGAEELSPAEAFGVYERNWRHLDLKAMDDKERDLVNSLRLAFGEGARPGV